MNPSRASGAASRSRISAIDQVVGDELARLHDGLGLEPERRALAHGGPQDVARRDGGDPQALREELRLSALAAARRPEEDDAHQLARRPRMRLFFRNPV